MDNTDPPQRRLGPATAAAETGAGIASMALANEQPLRQVHVVEDVGGPEGGAGG